MHAIVQGLDITYQTAGKGPVVLMLHGWGSNMQTFDGLAKELSRKFKVVRLDLPGFGSSQAPKTAWNLDDYAVFLDAFVDKISLAGLHGLIGHSLGGRLAIRAQATKHALSSKLVLLASHGIANPHSPRLVAYRWLAKVLKVALLFLPTAQRSKVRQRFYERIGSTDYLQVTPAMKQTFQNIINQDLRSDAATLAADTLLVYGTQDDQTPPKFGLIFAETIPKSHLELVDGAGHYVHIDQPEKVAGLVGAFL